MPPGKPRNSSKASAVRARTSFGSRAPPSRGRRPHRCWSSPCRSCGYHLRSRCRPPSRVPTARRETNLIRGVGGRVVKPRGQDSARRVLLDAAQPTRPIRRLLLLELQGVRVCTHRCKSRPASQAAPASHKIGTPDRRAASARSWSSRERGCSAAKRSCSRSSSSAIRAADGVLESASPAMFSVLFAADQDDRSQRRDTSSDGVCLGGRDGDAGVAPGGGRRRRPRRVDAGRRLAGTPKRYDRVGVLRIGPKKAKNVLALRPGRLRRLGLHRAVRADADQACEGLAGLVDRAARKPARGPVGSPRRRRRARLRRASSSTTTSAGSTIRASAPTSSPSPTRRLAYAKQWGCGSRLATCAGSSGPPRASAATLVLMGDLLGGGRSTL